MSKRRLLHLLMTRELKQCRATLAEEIQRCVRIQHFDGILAAADYLANIWVEDLVAGNW